MDEQRLEPVFVEFIPEDLDAGMLYISTRFRTASHLCACGCGLKVVTPIKPAKWRFTYDGETVSLSPSVGRWQLPCKSHYLIIRNKVVWARPFSDNEMRLVQERDATDVHDYYDRRATISELSATSTKAPPSLSADHQRISPWSRAMRLMRRR